MRLVKHDKQVLTGCVKKRFHMRMFVGQGTACRLQGTDKDIVSRFDRLDPKMTCRARHDTHFQLSFRFADQWSGMFKRQECLFEKVMRVSQPQNSDTLR